ncbi:hypothetical protein CIT292_05940 [Citrobacter youngae ATCC 29220]|uniref:Uncharacterized protein n=1 Tax=Citrobacter youngae ATCC 29220 TaxID=500640 RepID=D4B6K3_9ENTR|nr:hypothetical protein CIT292_05940 [Citrobacter youngae ATCC 29220]
MSLFGDNLTPPMSGFPDTLILALSLLPDGGVNALSGLQPHFPVGLDGGVNALSGLQPPLPVGLISVAPSGSWTDKKAPHEEGLDDY